MSSYSCLAFLTLIACSLAAPQNLGYQLPSGTVSYTRQQSSPVRFQQRRVGYVQPTTAYVQPTTSYVQPTASYVQPAVNYAQVSHVQPVEVNHIQAQHVSHIQPAQQISQIQPVQQFSRIQSGAVGFNRPQPQFRQDNFNQRPVAILRLVQENNFDGNFNYDFEGENGIKAEARGQLKAIQGSEQPAQVMTGSYSYIAPDGTPITTNWYADETGFHAEGAHLPVPPPIPAEIQRSLEYIRSLPPNPEDLKYN